MGALLSGWNEPSGVWFVERGALRVPGSVQLEAGSECKASVFTLCGAEVVEADCVCKAAMPAFEFARRTQLVVSMHHVMRRNCTKCRDAYQHALSPAERKWLYSEFPQLGPIIGMSEVQQTAVAPKDASRFNEIHANAKAAVDRLASQSEAERVANREAIKRLMSHGGQASGE